jgi:hypothetical protein
LALSPRAPLGGKPKALAPVAFLAPSDRVLGGESVVVVGENAQGSAGLVAAVWDVDTGGNPPVLGGIADSDENGSIVEDPKLEGVLLQGSPPLPSGPPEER